MVLARIKTKRGTEIEIESDRETIKEIILFLKRREEQESKFQNILLNRRNQLAHGRPPATLTDALIKLKTEGFFKNKRTITDIGDELARKGFHYPTTTLSAVLIHLLRRGELGRVKEDKQWRYVED